MTTTLANKFGTQSEYFRLSFVDADGNTTGVAPESITMTVSSSKKLVNIYRVKADGTTEAVQYEQVDGTHVLIKNPVAGDYLFEYEKTNQKDDNQQSLDATEGKLPDTGTGLNLWWLVGGGVIVIGLIAGGIMVNNRRR